VGILVDRGDIQGCSFGFRVAPGGDRWEDVNGRMVRELLNVDLAEITLTADPAYQDTSVAIRSMPQTISFGFIDLETNQLWMQTV
jgi:HK97 family phage prohead protease